MKSKKIFVSFVLAAFVLTIWWLNTCYYFCSDDCFYGSGWLLNHSQRLGTVSNAFLMTLHDFHRPIVHFIARTFFGCIPKPIYNICNTLMLCLMILLICRLALGKWRVDMEKLLLAVALVYLILCKGESYLWGAGTFNYVWVAVWVMSFCLMREYLERGAIQRGRAILLFIPALLCGWSQEGLSLPVLFAVGICCLVRKLRLSFAEWVIYFGYGIGCLFLAAAEGGRVGAISHHTVMGMVLNTLKMAVTVKAVWLLAFGFIFVKEKKVWLRANQFELLVIMGSLLMITYCGFNGERSLWAANLFAIIILVRTVTLRGWMSWVIGLALLMLFPIVCTYGWQLHKSFKTFLDLYLTDPQYVTYHERIDCGIFSRFFFQMNYHWVSKSHGMPLGWYYGRSESPISIPRIIYDELYKGNSFCSQQNKLPFGEFYTTPEITTIVMPLPSEVKKVGTLRAKVEYAFPNGIGTIISRSLNVIKNPQPSPMNHTRCLKTPHGDYLLISKEYGSDQYIRAIHLTSVVEE